jgi:glyoxylase-like metal-dependent hydrolase (beta-lactamase superfamily II)
MKGKEALNSYIPWGGGSMELTERVDNVYLIDTKMFGFEKYNAAYLVKGKEIALVDTGGPGRWETVRQGIKAHGFSPSDISHIFITHTHTDHCGNVAPLLRECPEARVYVHPLGSENLTDPSIAQAIRKKVYNPAMFARFSDMEPVPPSRIQCLNDGDVFELGNGEILKIIFAPGHQPDGIVILEEKNMGLFINDLVGNYLQDADAHYALNPAKSDHEVAIASLRKLMDIPVSILYMGHYGISDRPKQVMIRAIAIMQQLLDVGSKYVREGQTERIADKVFEMTMPELEKLRPVRGDGLYQYATQEHMASQAQIFTEYCRKKFGSSPEPAG